MFELLQAEEIWWWLNHFSVNYLQGPLQLHGNYDARWPFGTNTSLPASVSSDSLPRILIHFIISVNIGRTFCAVITAPVHTLAVILMEAWMSSLQPRISGLCWFLINVHVFLELRKSECLWWQKAGGGGLTYQLAWFKASALLALAWQARVSSVLSREILDKYMPLLCKRIFWSFC